MYRCFSWNSRTIWDVLAVMGILISWTTWYSEWSFSAILYSTLWHVCALASIFLHVEKKSFSHDLCYGKTAGRLWCILTFSSMSICSNFKFHFITQMYISSNIFTRKKKSFSHHLRYGKSAWPFMMTPIMGRPDGTYGDNWDLPRPNFIENSLIHIREMFCQRFPTCLWHWLLKKSYWSQPIWKSFHRACGR